MLESPQEPTSDRLPSDPRASQPSLSVLVPAYNAERLIGPTLDALLAELGGQGELVVCDDGSTDSTPEVFTRHTGDSPGASMLRKPNAGAAAARNAAFRASTGGWVMFFDADDLLKPGSLAGMLRVAAEHPDDVVHCGWATFDADPGSLDPGPVLATEPLPGWEWLRRSYLTDYPTYTGSLLLPRALVERVGPWDERLSFQDDAEFFARAICAAPCVHYCAAAQFWYRHNAPDSLSKRGGRRRSESHLLAAELAARHLLEARDSTETREAAARQLLRASQATYLSTPDISALAESRAWALAPSGFRPPKLITGGSKLHALQALLGWKGALRTRAWVRSVAGRGRSANPVSLA